MALMRPNFRDTMLLCSQERRGSVHPSPSDNRLSYNIINRFSCC